MWNFRVIHLHGIFIRGKKARISAIFLWSIDKSCARCFVSGSSRRFFAFKIRGNENRRLVGSRREWLARRYTTGTFREGNEWKGWKARRGWRDFDPSLIPRISPLSLACGLNSRKSSLAIPSTTPESVLESLHFPFFFFRHRRIKARWTIRSFSSIISIFRILNFKLLRENSIINEY